jgi:hypothetical protein
MKKQSITLFIVWGVSASILTCIYLALMMLQTTGFPFQQWSLAIYLFTMLYSICMMLQVRKRAKTELIIWLAIVSKALLIAYTAFTALWAVIFGLSQLLT